MEQVKVGQIFVASWGYSMIITEFFRVTRVYPSGKLVDIEALKQEEKGTGFLSGTTKPAEPLTRVENYDQSMLTRVKVAADDKGTPRLFMRQSRGRAYPYDATKTYTFDHCD
jgi:hypothetical protein